METNLRINLKIFLAKTQIKNPNYSLRALARDIGLSPSVISDYLNEKRSLTPKSKQKIIVFLEKVHS